MNSDYINTINTFNMPINIRQWIISRSDTFMHQFIFYFRDLQFDYQEAINRASSEADDIYTEMRIRILDILNNENITDKEKLEYITNAI